MPIKPHGGVLVNRIVEGKLRETYEQRIGSMESIHLTPKEVCDLEMIATGAMSPLEGFMCNEDYMTVLDFMRLSNGLPWTIPVNLSVDADQVDKYKEGEDIALYTRKDGLLAILHLEEKWKFDKEMEAKKVYLTEDKKHPGVAAIMNMGDYLLGGKVSMIHRPINEKFSQYRLDPKETRVLFKQKGWSRIVAFQTRNPIHRAHEYLQKCALEVADGLLIHPLMGATKSDDISPDVRMKCYQSLMGRYYPRDRVVLSVFPAAMRYAGPREAVFHAIVRKNYGCTHFIVGRDHAGVGKYYGTYDAHYIFSEFDREEIDIIPMFFDHAFYCKVCGNMASTKTCPHETSDHVFLSGTAVREMLSKGEIPPPEFTRKEVAEILAENARETSIGMGI
jgi:sulfate adenylyltransferase